jgi:hypothetical protein
MTDRTWIKIHSGLTNDPKHREEMGIRVWLFMWLVDHADWETGIVEAYTDAWAAEEMEIPARTIEGQRQKLDSSGYIHCHQGQQSQNIRIMRWRNPKLVNPPQINIPGDEKSWYAIPRTHPRSKLRTPTLDSDSIQKEQQQEISIFTIWEQEAKQQATPLLVDDLTDLEKTYGRAALIEGIREAVRTVGAGRFSAKYVSRILANRSNGNGHKSPQPAPKQKRRIIE